MAKTDNPGPAKRYDDACAAAHAMEILGERWAALVVRELHTGPRRFTDIRAALPGISANVLTQRLDGLEAATRLSQQLDRKEDQLRALKEEGQPTWSFFFIS